MSKVSLDYQRGKVGAQFCPRALDRQIDLALVNIYVYVFWLQEDT